MARNAWVDTIAAATGSGTAVANSTSETILFPDVTLAANYLENGRTLRLTARGQYSTTSAPTLRFRVRLGGVAGTLIADSGTITAGSGVTAAQWKVSVDMTVRSNGSSGTIMAMGDAIVFSATAPTVGSATGAPALAPMSAGGITTPATASVDFTTSQALSLTVTWGTGDPANTITGIHRTVESLN